MTIARVFALHVLRACTWQGLGEPRFDQFPLRMVKPDHRLRLQQGRGDPATRSM
jgi:hypothetical protein